MKSREGCHRSCTFWNVGDEYRKMICADISNLTAYALFAALYPGFYLRETTTRDREIEDMVTKDY